VFEKFTVELGNVQKTLSPPQVSPPTHAALYDLEHFLALMV